MINEQSARSRELRKVNEIHCTIYIFPWRRGNRNQQRGGGCHFDVESGTFKGKFGTLMWPSGTLMFTFNTLYFYFYKMPCVVLSRLFVCKIQPEVCSSVCECS